MAELKLTRIDRQKWITNTAIFLAPVLVIYLVYVQTEIQDGFAWTDFIPSDFVIGSMFLYVINVILDITRKFIGNGGTK